MQIPCREIADTIQSTLIQKVHLLKQSGKNLKLVAYLIGDSPAQLSFVTIKRRIAEKLGINFEFIQFEESTLFDTFLQNLQMKANEPQTTGVIVQLPLPEGYNHQHMYDTIPQSKEIEGHTAASSFHFPLSLSVLTGIKYIFGYHKQNKSVDAHIVIDLVQDIPFFYETLKDKKIVIVGRGDTGGKPIGKSLERMNVTYEMVHSQTEKSEEIYKQADIIITATGKKILHPDMLKPGVILLNVGLRKEGDTLKGDYDEEEIKDLASYYTPTPGGLGPLDVLYLYKNVIDAA